MPSQPWVKVSGDWKKVTTIWEKVAGVWTRQNRGYVKVSGSWKVFYGQDGFEYSDPLLSPITIVSNPIALGDVAYIGNNEIYFCDVASVAAIATSPATYGSDKRFNMVSNTLAGTHTTLKKKVYDDTGFTVNAVRICADPVNRIVYGVCYGRLYKKDIVAAPTVWTLVDATFSSSLGMASAHAPALVFSAGNIYALDGLGNFGRYNISGTSYTSLAAATLAPATKTVGHSISLLELSDGKIFAWDTSFTVVAGNFQGAVGKPLIFDPAGGTWDNSRTSFYSRFSKHALSVHSNVADGSVSTNYLSGGPGSKCALLSGNRVAMLVDTLTVDAASINDPLFMTQTPKMYVYNVDSDTWDENESLPPWDLAGTPITVKSSHAWLANIGLPDTVGGVLSPYAPIFTYTKA